MITSMIDKRVLPIIATGDDNGIYIILWTNRMRWKHINRVFVMAVDA